jgi:hypothetical protein
VSAAAAAAADEKNARGGNLEFARIFFLPVSDRLSFFLSSFVPRRPSFLFLLAFFVLCDPFLMAIQALVHSA